MPRHTRQTGARSLRNIFGALYVPRTIWSSDGTRAPDFSTP